MSIYSSTRALDSEMVELGEISRYRLKDQTFSTENNECCCFKEYKFRVWQILLIVFIVLVIIALLCLIIAMFGPGNTDLKYSAVVATDVPGVVNGGEDTKAPTEEPTTASGEETTPAVTTATTEQQPSPKPTTAPETTVKQTTPQTTGQTSAGPSTVSPASTSPPSTTAEQTTTAAPTTTGPAPTTTAPSLECGVAIVGAGISGLLLAHTLLQSKKETSVCIFERELDRLGGKIFDHRFTQAPDITVGLGELIYKGDSDNDQDLQYYLHPDNETDLWPTKYTRVEARGVFVDGYSFDSLFDSLKSKAFPTLLDQAQMKKWNKTISDTAKFDVVESNYSQFSTADTFLSNELSPEGAELMENAYGFKGDYMQKINPFSYRTYLEKKLHVLKNHGDNGRPLKGMNDSITILKQKVERQGGKIYLKETVTSIDKRVDGFVIQTENFIVKANKTVITPGPGALKMIKGDVIQNITDNEIFKAIVSVPAFHGAAVYQDAWWNDTTAAQLNNTLQPLEMFISTSNCLGITMPYKGVGPNGTAVLHTIANNGGCSDKWGEILAISPDEVDKELKRALKYKFQREDIPDPLETKYKYWKEGFWYLQKPGADFNLTVIRQWAKRPLTGQDVFLVNRAFYNFGGYLDDDIRSTKEALDEGWKLPLPF